MWVVSIDRPYIPIHFRKLFTFFLKDPGPLNSKKRIWASKQLFMCADRIMWPPASKIRYRDDTCMILSQYRVYTSIIEANLYTLFICIFSRILDSPQSIDRVLSLFSSRPNWDPPPRQIACRRGGGESQFRRGDRHCGSLGIYVLCGTASLENLPNKFCKNPRNLRVCGRFLMCFPVIDR